MENEEEIVLELEENEEGDGPVAEFPATPGGAVDAVASDGTDGIAPDPIPAVPGEESGEESSGAEVEPAADLPPALSRDDLQAVLRSLSTLQEQFDAKLRFDAGKQTVIDRQHEELEKFRKDLAWNLVKPVFLDIVRVIDDIEGQLPFFKNPEKPASTEDVLKFLSALGDDLRDILAGKGVESYTAETGEPFVPVRQNIVKTVPTADPSLNKVVVEQARPGYAASNGQTILRPAQVRVYAYKAPPPGSAEPAPQEAAEGN